MPLLRLFATFTLFVASAAHAGEPIRLPAARPLPASDPFARFDVPEAWKARFWASPGAKAVLALDTKALAALVPTQAGLHFCRCPACDASERDNPLGWSADKPEVLTCRKCGATFTNDKVPAKTDGKVPEDSVEVSPRVFHKYPYHSVEAEKQVYPGERMYLSAKRDDEAREFLAKMALYAALRVRQDPGDAAARVATVLVLRFAQVYPSYATHSDQPGQPKTFDRADLPPPYPGGYQMAKWDWSGHLNVPLNLVIAYALIRNHPALAEAGRALGDAHPNKTIERDLLRASAEFVRRQPEEASEAGLVAVRGLLAVGRVANDEELLRDAAARLDRFAERGFYHDGLWGHGDALAHRRVQALLDGWIDHLLPGRGGVAMVDLARSAGGAPLVDPMAIEIQQASFPTVATTRRPGSEVHGPTLLGGAGLARLSVGRGADALDVELRGFGDAGSGRTNRLALRLAVGGKAVLGDLDDRAPIGDGWDKATASHNTVMVDGLNQRETIAQAHEPARGADVLFFAADPDFQVATFEDRHAYPTSASRYRHTVVAASGSKTRYAVSIFEVHGGLQHDQLLHAAPGSSALWETSIATQPGPHSLLPQTIPYLPNARESDGRWFIQSLGAFQGLKQASADRPFQAWLRAPGPPSVRLHLLGDMPATVMTATTPDPTTQSDENRRAALILRRTSREGATLRTTFVTVYEPLGTSPASFRAARVPTDSPAVVLMIETIEGVEHLVVNLHPGQFQEVTLADGQILKTDGLAVRATPRALALAGGTLAEVGGRRVAQARVGGTIVGSTRETGAGSLGSFVADAPLADPRAVFGRTLLIRHGDGTTRGWTIVGAENLDQARSRFRVREEPGFLVDSTSGVARYYQYPGDELPGPHRFWVARIAR